MQNVAGHQYITSTAAHLVLWMGLDDCRRQVNLWLVGPEMSIQGHMKGSMLRPAMSASCYRGTAAEFIQERFPEGKRPSAELAWYIA